MSDKTSLALQKSIFFKTSQVLPQIFDFVFVRKIKSDETSLALQKSIFFKKKPSPSSKIWFTICKKDKEWWN